MFGINQILCFENKKIIKYVFINLSIYSNYFFFIYFIKLKILRFFDVFQFSDLNWKCIEVKYANKQYGHSKVVLDGERECYT